ncbi:unnamed protein product, partial [Closterium sp. NIES-64]
MKPTRVDSTLPPSTTAATHPAADPSAGPAADPTPPPAAPPSAQPAPFLSPSRPLMERLQRWKRIFGPRLVLLLLPDGSMKMYAPGGKTPAHSASSGDLFGGKTPAHSAANEDLRGGKNPASGGDVPAPVIAGLPRVLDSAHLSRSARHHTRSRVPRRPRGGGGRASARQLTVADVMREHPGYSVGSMSSKRAVLPRDKVLHPGGTYYLSKPALAAQGALETQSAEGKGAGGESAETEGAEGQRGKQQSANQRGAQAANEPAGRGLQVGGTTASSSAGPARDGLVEGGGDAQADEDPGGADHGLLVDILRNSQPENFPHPKDGARQNQQQHPNQRRGMHMVKGILTLDITSDASDNDENGNEDDYDFHNDDNFYGFTSSAFEAGSDAESDADSFATTGCTGGSCVSTPRREASKKRPPPSAGRPPRFERHASVGSTTCESTRSTESTQTIQSTQSTLSIQSMLSLQSSQSIQSTQSTWSTRSTRIRQSVSTHNTPRGPTLSHWQREEKSPRGTLHEWKRGGLPRSRPGIFKTQQSPTAENLQSPNLPFPDLHEGCGRESERGRACGERGGVGGERGRGGERGGVGAERGGGAERGRLRRHESSESSRLASALQQLWRQGSGGGGVAQRDGEGRQDGWAEPELGAATIHSWKLPRSHTVGSRSGVSKSAGYGADLRAQYGIVSKSGEHGDLRGQYAVSKSVGHGADVRARYLELRQKHGLPAELTPAVRSANNAVFASNKLLPFRSNAASESSAETSGSSEPSAAASEGEERERSAEPQPQMGTGEEGGGVQSEEDGERNNFLAAQNLGGSSKALSKNSTDVTTDGDFSSSRKGVVNDASAALAAASDHVIKAASALGLKGWSTEEAGETFARGVRPIIHEGRPLIPELKRPIWEKPPPGGKVPGKEEFALRREMVEFRAEKNVVVVTFANHAFMDFVLNWVKHLTDLGVTNILIGAMDNEILTALYQEGVPVFDLESGMSPGDSSTLPGGRACVRPGEWHEPGGQQVGHACSQQSVYPLLPFLCLGAMDPTILKALYQEGVPVFDLESGMSPEDSGWGTPVFHAMGREKVTLVNVFLSMGVELLICDTDTVWLKNPLPFIARYPTADVLTSSDHLVRSVDDESLEKWQQAQSTYNVGILHFRPTDPAKRLSSAYNIGILHFRPTDLAKHLLFLVISQSAYNIGILHFRPTDPAKRLARAWAELLASDAKIWDQNGFNELMRKHMGPDVDPAAADHVFWAFDGSLKLGILPVSVFCSGHTYFVQHLHKVVGLEPYALHATFQFAGTPGKRHRFREAMAFYDPPEYYDPPGGIVSFVNDIPEELLTGGEHTLSTHFHLVNHQLKSIRSALAIALILNRTLVMPSTWARFDRIWYPHKGILDNTATPQPFLCPLDHILNVDRMLPGKLPEEEFGPAIPFREYSFLDNPRVPKELRASKLSVRICNDTAPDCPVETDAQDLPRAHTLDLVLRKGVREKQLREALSRFSDVKWIEFSFLHDVFGGWDDKELEKKFRWRLRHYTGIWCCVHAHPDRHPLSMKVNVFSRSGKEIVKGGLQLPDEASVADLQKALHKTNKKWYPARQRFTLPAPASGAKPVVLDAKKRLAEYSTGTTLDVVFKDLGPQIGFKTVFFWEYFGPLVLYSLFYFFPQVFYVDGAKRKLKDVQTYALIYWSFHYTKRIFETFFVHRFSHGTMPLQNLFRNCGYYWTFAAFVSFFVNHPLYTPVSETQMMIGFGIAIVNQLSNLYCHIILRNLRSGSSSGYQIPSGFLFNFITCANYTTEITAWLGFNIATQSVAGYLFMLAGAMQMAEWALAKHKRLVK